MLCIKQVTLEKSVIILYTYIYDIVHIYPIIRFHMNSSTLHIKVNPLLAKKLKLLSRKRNMPVGELVRQAVANTYQLDFSDLPSHQQTALSAYQGGYISLGKLAEEMGMTVFDLRHWLADHDIAQNTSYSDNDAKNA